MFFGRDESDFLLGERNGDLAAVFAKLRQVAIIEMCIRDSLYIAHHVRRST